MITRILVAVDGSSRAPRVLRAAAEIAMHFGAELTPFRAIQIPPEFPPAGRSSHADPLAAHIEASALEELRRLMKPLVGVKLGPPLVAVGQPWRAILECADGLNADLIVIGSHGYHGMDHILGTTAGKVANLARRNVLVVHNGEAPHSDSTPAA